MPQVENVEMEIFPFLLPSVGKNAGLNDEMIKLERRMTAMLTSRTLPSFFKTPDEINADFSRKAPFEKRGSINYSDTLDGCMNIQQSLSKIEGYMEENY